MQSTPTRTESPSAASLRALLHRLIKYKILNWKASSNDPDPNDDRVPADLDSADVVSSLRGGDINGVRHAVVLDIDHPAWLVRSTTPGHFHLYIDVPNGVSHPNYMQLLGLLADCGIIERGYASASQTRGFTSVRLPWIKKPAPDLPTPEPLGSLGVWTDGEPEDPFDGETF